MKLQRAPVALPKDYWLRTMPPCADGLSYGSAIHRFFAPKDWVEQLACVPEKQRPAAEKYLREIATRLRVVSAIKRRVA